MVTSTRDAVNYILAIYSNLFIHYYTFNIDLFGEQWKNAILCGSLTFAIFCSNSTTFFIASLVWFCSPPRRTPISVMKCRYADNTWTNNVQCGPAAGMHDQSLSRINERLSKVFQIVHYIKFSLFHFKIRIVQLNIHSHFFHFQIAHLIKFSWIFIEWRYEYQGRNGSIPTARCFFTSMKHRI